MSFNFGTIACSASIGIKIIECKKIGAHPTSQKSTLLDNPGYATAIKDYNTIVLCDTIPKNSSLTRSETASGSVVSLLNL